ncbi:MAG: urea ABC transporter permease subunit UrtC [Burkholderiaceae bacterium]
MNGGKRNGAIGGLALLALVILVVFPATLDIFRLNMVGKYLTYAFVAIGLVMLWGWGGILSLGQGIFFGLGGYAMAMFLKLEASDPEATKIQSTPGIPDFMDWNQLTELPAWWVPFKHLPFALIAVVAVPVALAFVIGFAMFKRRVSGVYFAIITQAVALILTVLIIGQQGYTGGVNGITDLKTLLGWDIRTDSAKYVLYFVNAALLLVSIALCWWVQSSKLGTLLLAMRDKENRVRFSGYDVGMFQIFAFCLAAGLAGIGGAMFTLQVGFMSPSFVGIVPSIEMVIFAAVGGRMSLVGAVYGTLLVNFGKTYFSESFPDLWLFLMAALFIGVVLAFPDGLAGVYQKYVAPRLFGRKAGRATTAAVGAAATAAAAADESGTVDAGRPAGATSIATGGSGAAGNGAGGVGAGGSGAEGKGAAGGGALGNGAVGNGGPRVHGQGA